MPLISTRGGLSSRGFGQLSGARTPTLVTYTFPAGTSTFTVPSTTNLLVSAVGAGANGTPAGTTTQGGSSTLYILRKSDTNVPNAKPDFYELFYESLAIETNRFNQGGNIYYDQINFRCGPDNLTNVIGDVRTLLIDRVIAGSATGVAGGSGTPPTSGQVTYASLGGQFQTRIYTWSVLYQRLVDVDPTTGASTTGFGLTFPGGAGGTSSTTTFNNVAVVPNQTYTIQNNKSLTITYFV